MRFLKLFTAFMCVNAFGLSEIDRGQINADKNYVVNGGAQSSKAGWISYADAAGVTPVDCTGGSPNITFTASTSSPLVGAASFTIDKDAANRQGQGVSYAITLDPAYSTVNPTIHTITAQYTITAGTYGYGSSTTDSDLEAYIYDVTNSQIIQPSGFKFDGGEMRATFQPNKTSSSYRLCLHVATTNASAWTLKFDEVRVVPQSKVIGSFASEWKAYTPTFVGFGTPSAISFLSRRVGDSLEVVGTFGTGTNTGSTATISLGYNGGNSNVVADAVKTNSVNTIGQFTCAQASTTYFHSSIIGVPSSSSIKIGAQTSSTAESTATIGTTYSNGVSCTLYFTIPISGWGTTQVLSENNDNRSVSANYIGSPPTGTLNTSFNTVTFSTNVSDTHAGYSAGSYTIQVPGYYDISAALDILGTYTVNQYGAVSIFVDGVEKYTKYDFAPSTGTETQPMVSVKGVLLNSGQVITIRSRSSSTSPSFTSDSHTNYFSISRTNNGSQVAASEHVFFKGYATGNTSLTNSTTTVIALAGLIKDTHSAFASNKYTFPRTGSCHVDASIIFAPNSTGQRNISIRKNGTTVVCDQLLSAASLDGSNSNQGQCSSTDFYNQGDYIEMTGFQNSGGSLNTDISGGDGTKNQFLSVECN